MEQYLHYFCGNANDPEALLNTEPLRISFYKLAAAFLRAYQRDKVVAFSESTAARTVTSADNFHQSLKSRIGQ